MHVGMEKLSFFLLIILSFGIKAQQNRRNHRDSTHGDVARYRIKFYGLWSAQNFPKQYPRFRPPAQWSKVVGRSHDQTYSLWREGGVADAGFREFIQEGRTQILESRENQGFNGIFDTFTAQPVKSGEGETSVDVFVHSNFSKISLAVKIVPSPDWFVGIDSINLWGNGEWKSSFSQELDPFDGGTDKGFTFTSPNWASRPPEKIYRITSRFPNHRANSFYYPERQNHPKIAKVVFVLLAEYNEEKVHKRVSHQKEIEEPIDFTEKEKKREELEEKLILAGEPIGTTSTTSNDLMSEEEGSTMSGQGELLSEHTQVPDYNEDSIVDCMVGNWGEWATCSKTCGFGTQVRKREVLQIPRGGMSCPTLEQSKWCGSMRTCRVAGKTSLFSWVPKPKIKGKKRVARRHHQRQRDLQRNHHQKT